MFQGGNPTEKPVDRRPSIAERASLALENLTKTASNTNLNETNVEETLSMNIEDYETKQIIGQGSSAVVYLARYRPTGKSVAIKVIDLDKFERNQIDELRRELQTMFLSKHPNLLPVYGSFVSGSKLYIVTPFLSGGSGLDIMKTKFKQGLEENCIATILKQVLQGLEYLHAHGLIHRDIKAGNLLVSEAGLVQLADFGVSSSLTDHGSRNTSRKTFVGTPCWMAPEVMDQSGYDYKADIWSFGITALELAYGHAPYAKYPPMKVLMMTLQNAPPTLNRDETVNKYSKSFKEMIDSCLQKDPAKRPTAEKLLSHAFFKNAKKPQYLVSALLEGLPPITDRRHKQNNPETPEEENVNTMDEWDFDEKSLKSSNLRLETAGSLEKAEPREVQDSPDSIDESEQQEQEEDLGDLGFKKKGVKFDTGSMPRKGRFTLDNQVANAVGTEPTAVPLPVPAPTVTVAAEVKKGRFSVMDNSPATLPTSPMLAKSPDYFELNQQSSTASIGNEGKAGRFAFQNVTVDGPVLNTQSIGSDEPKMARKFTITSTDHNTLARADSINLVANMSALDRKSRFQVVDQNAEMHPLIAESMAPIPSCAHDTELLVFLKKQNDTQRLLIQDLISMVKSARSMPPTRLNSSESEKDVQPKYTSQ